MIGKHKYVSIAFFTGIFLFYFFIAFQTPYTGDDWTWGTQRGMNRLENNFADYNGRYLSNMIEILATRFAWLRYLVMSIFATALVYVIGSVTGQANRMLYWLLAFLFMLLLPTDIYAQTFGWTAGFVNYVPSMVLLILYIMMIKNIFSEQPPTYQKWQVYAAVPLGLSTQLIVEHVTLFSLFVAGMVMLYTFMVHKRFYLVHLVYLLSSVIGAVIMFSNSAYWNILSGQDKHAYREINNGTDAGFLSKAYDVFSGDMYRYLFIDNPSIHLFIGAMVVILIVGVVSKSGFVNFFWKPIVLLTVVGFLLYVLAFQHMLGNAYLGALTNDAEAIISAFYFIAITLSVIVFVKDQHIRNRLLLYLFGIVLLSAPFAYVTPYGPRAALASYIFMVLFGLELFAYNKTLHAWRTKPLRSVLIGLVTAAVVMYANIFSVIGHANQERLDYLNGQVAANKAQIYLPDLPFSSFMWFSSPPDEHFNTMFKRFNDVPENVEIRFIPYTEWKRRQ
ncbi:DUF6056 family protein [Lentibacillus cibarius]|uniref:YfhO family protein n=1 Tax=Lentibacillus cibarius TaxID=2583219 RepID=A0A5S3QIU8_9BACI|nr:DUF6056 family protein [Lentibacillus cibarius]TMN21785.1 hypothetical protein FFL34_06420 [Lentibacillus cibarius]